MTPTPVQPFTWLDEVGRVHVVGTHDLAVARRDASLLVRQELELSQAQADTTLAGEPVLWWALPAHPDGPDGDEWWPEVAIGTPSAVPITTWELVEPVPAVALVDPAPADRPATGGVSPAGRSVGGGA